MKGKVVGGFSESANLKGIDIAGNAGQPVLASAPGRVVYAGSGLRGYGKLIIISNTSLWFSLYLVQFAAKTGTYLVPTWRCGTRRLLLFQRTG